MLLCPLLGPRSPGLPRSQLRPGYSGVRDSQAGPASASLLRVFLSLLFLNKVSRGARLCFLGAWRGGGFAPGNVSWGCCWTAGAQTWGSSEGGGLSALQLPDFGQVTVLF